MGMKKMVRLCKSPSSARFCPLIGFIRKPNSSCRFSPIHAASLKGNQRRAGCAVLYMYFSHCGGDACVSDLTISIWLSVLHSLTVIFILSARLGIDTLPWSPSSTVDQCCGVCLECSMMCIYLYVLGTNQYIQVCTWTYKYVLDMYSDIFVMNRLLQEIPQFVYAWTSTFLSQGGLSLFMNLPPLWTATGAGT